uniref:EGF domain specific O-linked N-acetylglucosamine transferase n=1 Tax=Mus musculus TaxID=10090 RepID=D3Z052_MOUSE
MLMLLVFGVLLHEVPLSGQDKAHSEASTTSPGGSPAKYFLRIRVTIQLWENTRSLPTTLLM